MIYRSVYVGRALGNVVYRNQQQRKHVLFQDLRVPGVVCSSRLNPFRSFE